VLTGVHICTRMMHAVNESEDGWSSGEGWRIREAFVTWRSRAQTDALDHRVVSLRRRPLDRCDPRGVGEINVSATREQCVYARLATAVNGVDERRASVGTQRVWIALLTVQQTGHHIEMARNGRSVQREPCCVELLLVGVSVASGILRSRCHVGVVR